MSYTIPPSVLGTNAICAYIGQSSVHISTESFQLTASASLAASLYSSHLTPSYLAGSSSTSPYIALPPNGLDACENVNGYSSTLIVNFQISMMTASFSFFRLRVSPLISL